MEEVPGQARCAAAPWSMIYPICYYCVPIGGQWAEKYWPVRACDSLKLKRVNRESNCREKIFWEANDRLAAEESCAV